VFDFLSVEMVYLIWGTQNLVTLSANRRTLAAAFSILFNPPAERLVSSAAQSFPTHFIFLFCCNANFFCTTVSFQTDSH